MKIAIIGSGISGLGAAYLLHPHHDITVYEKNHGIGGHSRTVEVKTPQGAVPVDTGFIVFNTRNYPHLTGLFRHLGVAVEKSDMSFAASIDHGWLEYGTKDVASIFAQKKNFLRPKFWKMVADVLRFHARAHHYLERGSSVSLATCLKELKMGDWFARYFLLPMGGAIWSTPLRQMLDFPAQSFVRFFDNHGLLSIRDQPQWYTVSGGSREYVKKIAAPFANRIRTSAGVVCVTRQQDKLLVEDSAGGKETYDQVVFACHANQALAMMDNPTPEQRRILGSFRYQENKAVLHSDISFMPKNRACWASWVYLSAERSDTRSGVSLSYWMNRLQNLDPATPLIVTLNPDRLPAPDLTHDTHLFEHPVFDRSAIDAQAEIGTLQGVDGLWYCGAYQRYGFHEDGLLSAVTVARKLKAPIPWE